MLNRRDCVLLPAAACVAALAPGRAGAQPADKPVKVIVPLPAGGSTDALARLLVDKLRNRYAPSVLVDNRAGAGGRIGVAAAKSVEADGSNLLFTPDFPLTMSPTIYPQTPYQSNDFAPVAVCGVTSMALTAGPGLPEAVKTVADFVAWARANPKAAGYASPSAGSTPHFVGMMFARAAGLNLLHIAYKGGAPAIQDLLGGQIPLSINPVGEVLEHAKSGRLRVLATTGPARSRFLPEVPTLAEAGYKDVVVQSWLGMFAPAATPPATVNRLNGLLLAVLQEPDVADAIARIGMELPARLSPAQFAALVRRDVEHWAAVIKATGFKAEE